MTDEFMEPSMVISYIQCAKHAKANGKTFCMSHEQYKFLEKSLNAHLESGKIKEDKYGYYLAEES